jgi:hypothetical protein
MEVDSFGNAAWRYRLPVSGFTRLIPPRGILTLPQYSYMVASSKLAGSIYTQRVVYVVKILFPYGKSPSVDTCAIQAQKPSGLHSLDPLQPVVATRTIWLVGNVSKLQAISSIIPAVDCLQGCPMPTFVSWQRIVILIA